MLFPVSGVETGLPAPLGISFGIAFFCSMAGISGAFLLLPYQISGLGYVGPGVSATNQVFNILACPAGVLRYAKEGRLLWPMVLFIALGTLPGVFLGALIRVFLLSGRWAFMLFAGCVLAWMGIRLLGGKKSGKTATQSRCQVLSFSARGFSFSFGDSIYNVPSTGLILLSLAVGLLGGIYGVGGGAIIMPFLVSIYGLPMHALAGASLFSTFLTSLAGVFFFWLLAVCADMPAAAPDWGLGFLLGCGGMGGMYCGAMFQKYVPARILRLLLALTLFITAAGYIWNSLGNIWGIFQ